MEGDDGNDEVTLAGAVMLYRRARRNELAASTRGHYAYVLHGLLRVLNPDMRVRHLRRKHIEAWMAAQTSSSSTIRANYSVIRGFTAWCVHSRYVAHDPCAGLRGPRQPRGVPRELTVESVGKILIACPDRRAELLVLLAVEEGLRVSEIARLERTDIDHVAQLMLVHGKGSKERWLPICDETAQAIRAYCAERPGSSGPLIRSETHPNRGIGSKQVARLIIQVMRDAGIKVGAFDGVSGHALRHTFAGHMLDNGGDIRDVQAALGHANLGATYIYLRRRQADTRLRESMGRQSYR